MACALTLATNGAAYAETGAKTGADAVCTEPAPRAALLSDASDEASALAGTIAAVPTPYEVRLESGESLRLHGLVFALDRPGTNTADMLIGQEVIARLKPESPDRYGRLAARVFLRRPTGAYRDLRAVLIERGLAVVNHNVTPRSCFSIYERLEDTAAREKRGHWGDGGFRWRATEPVAFEDLPERAYVLLEGVVQSAGVMPDRVYLNFGRRWSQDVTIIIKKALLPDLIAAGVDILALPGNRIRVRGAWKEDRGPLITLDSADQLRVGERQERPAGQ